jgi:hypothetical protein
MTSGAPIGGAIAELGFAVLGAAPVPYAAVPTLGFAVEITSRSGQPIRSVALDVQIQIAARRRAYSDAEQPQLLDVFGAPERWATTLRTLPWLRVSQVVPAFEGTTVVDVHVPCTYDFEVTAAKYLAALREGEVPLELLFGGTVFYTAESGLLQTAMINWDSEEEYRMPVAAWRETMDMYFPGSAWLRVEREAFERLYAFRALHSLTSWEQTFDRLLDDEA